ncbi:hypothetical protein CHCC20441_0523 [Bacillus licheniformis]|uniref:Uncharacterized protein n=1 Tax=Bacillus licheniformis TaxID=1402 RepID=A0A8B5YJ38_BACLI|nr:hypothetical protein B4092_3326 [Bacillus licheniformis]KYC80208.1 hypothetical protein B4091_3605 [Bacillus licheniformis]KYC93414.1 hypothetical protein B4164_3296 [Bacillus licheniformis]OLF86091.1 hypothetical protein B4094_4555 [Bacillus licheniformis]OLG09878.1 hypothetical protein B4124_0522 [Bacillus licheniformis]
MINRSQRYAKNAYIKKQYAAEKNVFINPLPVLTYSSAYLLKPFFHLKKPASSGRFFNHCFFILITFQESFGR